MTRKGNNKRSGGDANRSDKRPRAAGDEAVATGPKIPGQMSESDIARGWFVSSVSKDGMSNAKFEAYYRGNVVPEADWEQFMTALRTSLPSSFRLSTINGLHEQLLERLRGDCFGLPRTPTTFSIPATDTEESYTVKVQAPTPLPWYSPKDYAWQVEMGKRVLRKVPAMQRFREFLMREDRQGNVTRQEAVSMIPPQLLDVQPHHVVLDMCAAPGSKTAQLLEALHAGGPSVVPTGLVIANDADHKRAYMLVHQLKRLGSPAFLVSTHQGQFFPNLFVNASTAIGAAAAAAAPSAAAAAVVPLQFDRILCDVPCSGDGTIRKNPGIWRQWSVSAASGLHPLQLSIAWRAAQMLKVGGQLVYSTCSLNPMENEAVVAELVRRAGGSLRIVDVSGRLPGLISEPGMEDWKVLLEPSYPPGHAKAQAEARAAAAAAGLPAPAELTEMTHVDSLTAVDALTFNRRRRLRLSFFSPATLAQMRSDAAAEKEARAALTGEAAAAAEAAEAARAAKSAEVAATRPGYVPVPPFGRDPAQYPSPMTVGPCAGRVPSGAELGLRHCVRILPHKQDTGGFFIVLLEKVAPLPNWDQTRANPDAGDDDAAAAAVEDGAKPAASAKGGAKPPKGSNRHDPNREKFIGITATAETAAPAHHKPQEKIWNDFPFVAIEPSLSAQLTSDFGLVSAQTSNLPAEFQFNFDSTRLFSRSDVYASTGKRLYYVSPAISALLKTRENFRLKIVHSGLKVFECTTSAYAKHAARSAAEAGASTGAEAEAAAASAAAAAATASASDAQTFRLAQDAVSFVAPGMRRQVVDIALTDLIALLRRPTGVRVADMQSPARELLEVIPQLGAGTALPADVAAASQAAAAAAGTAAVARVAAAQAASTKSGAAAALELELERASAAVDVAVASSAATGVALGSLVLRLPRSQLPAGVIGTDILCAAWRSGVSLSLMVDAAERASLLALVEPQTEGEGDAEAAEGDEAEAEAEAENEAAPAPADD